MADEFNLSIPIEKAVTPPSKWYTAEVHFQKELAQVFRNSWQPVLSTHQIPEKGNYLAGTFIDQPYIIVRGEDGEVRAFHNVCRHHAAELVDKGQGCIQRFACPYHGWNYSLKGDLVSAPRMQGAENFNKTDFGLKQIPVKIIGPLICLQFGQPQMSPDQQFAPVWQRLNWEKLKFHSRRSYEIECNWKVYVDNYLDGGYHVGVLHKGLTGQLDLSEYKTQVHGDFSIQTCGGKDQERIGGEAYYAWMYPNFMINRYGPVMDTNWVVPLSASRCLTVFDFYFEESVGDEFIGKSLAMSELVQQEDVLISESVQRGLNSQGYGVGRYAPQVEQAMHAFHVRLARDLQQSS